MKINSTTSWADTLNPLVVRMAREAAACHRCGPRSLFRQGKREGSVTKARRMVAYCLRDIGWSPGKIGTELGMCRTSVIYLLRDYEPQVVDESGVWAI